MSKKFLSGFLKVAIGIGAMTYVFVTYWEPKNGGLGIKDLFKQTPDYWLVACIFALTGITISCQVVRWYLLVRALDLPFSLRNAFRLGMVGYFFNTLLPGSIGGDLVKAFFIYREQPGRKAAAVATVMVDRLMGLFGLLLFASVIGGIFWATGDERVATNPYLKKIVLVCSILVGIAVVGWIVLGITPERKVERAGELLKSIKWVGPPLAEIWGAVALYRKHPRLLYLTIPITAFAQAVMVLYLHLAVRVFPTGGVGSFGEHFIIAPIGYIAQAFFPAPGGVGGAEAIFGYLYTLIGLPEQTGIIGRLTIRSAEIGLGIAGYIFYLAMKAEIPIEEAEKKAESAVSVA